LISVLYAPELLCRRSRAAPGAEVPGKRRRYGAGPADP
jgi:hypothetical protein